MILRNQFYSDKRRAWRRSSSSSVAVGTVKSRVSRARAALEALLASGEFARDGAPAGQATGRLLADLDQLRHPASQGGPSAIVGESEGGLERDGALAS